MRQVLTAGTLGAGLALALVSLVTGQDLARAGAITRLNDVDVDFAPMGEYRGDLPPAAGLAAGTSQRVGLQVVALGNGRFFGALYRGGLPGNGGDREPCERMEGERDGQVVRLTGPEHSARIENGQASLLDPPERLLGELPKIERRSVTLGAPPPPGAYVLFDGQNAQAFQRARLADNLLQVGTELIPRFRDYTLHVEFLIPYMPELSSQGRGNSGVYLQSRYEVQILDSFGHKPEAGGCAGVYRYRAPDLNMTFPPLSWQTFDITFYSPRYDQCGRKIRSAYLTVLHNGVPVHRRVEVPRKTGAGRPEGPELLPIKLQDHGNPVQFRNIWLVAH